MNDPYPPSASEAAKHAAGEVADAVQDNFAAVIRRNPLQTVAIAVGVGFVLGVDRPLKKRHRIAVCPRPLAERKHPPAIRPSALI